ncbi:MULTISPECIES: hypothetical protein [unclassified Janthinobacterium]|uniref:hypothetical protein n=1 Tax=unclassified Janthinobacterium TaxID=2610881 RepID=UPI001113383F|nr:MULTISPECIES: hypothetical protein [unclassified Janthinobacterium]
MIVMIVMSLSELVRMEGIEPIRRSDVPAPQFAQACRHTMPSHRTVTTIPSHHTVTTVLSPP